MPAEILQLFFSKPIAPKAAPQAIAYYQVFIFADGTRLLSETPITVSEAKASHFSNAELVHFSRFNPHLRLALKEARASGKFPPALPREE